MNEYIKLKMRSFVDHCEYNFEEGNYGDELDILRLFLVEADFKDFMSNFDKKSFGIQTEFVDAEWSHKDNCVELCRLLSSDGKESFTMKFDNFKKMIEDWAALEKKRVPEIYFIMDDEGSITVRESLEEKK